MKLLLLIAIVYLAYRAGKSWLKRSLDTFSQGDSPQSSIDDMMVQDPVCGIYFPRREAVELHHGGKRYLFCSEACRDRFLHENE